MTKKAEGQSHFPSETELRRTMDVHRCLTLIESKLGWEASDRWVNYDFEKLSDIINERTGVRLSTTTLKRIWGKLKYTSAPTLTTLNTLARFAGYEDWREFKRCTVIPEESIVGSDSGIETVPKSKSRYYWLFLLIPLFLLGYVMISSTRKPSTIDPGKYTFRADKMVTEGVPNSVVFQYDAKAAPTDSVFIVQTWDITRKKLVPKDKYQHSAIYYYPGFFVTKLIVDQTIVKTHDLWITSDGWLCLAEQDPMPLYFKKEECIRDGVVEVNERILKDYNLTLHPAPPKIRFFNQRNLGDIMSDNFTFETMIKNPFRDGTNACQLVQILIQCKDDIIIIPLSSRKCVGDLHLYFCGRNVESDEADLSMFGVDLMEWTKLKVEVVDRNAILYVNDRKAYSLTFPNLPTGVVGVQYRFNGVGAVKETSFQANGRTIKL